MKNLFAFNSDYPLLFTHFYFWVFLAVVFAGFALLQKKVAGRNAFLCLASLFFYYKTSGLFVLILIFTTIFNFYHARLLYRSGEGKRRRTLLWIGLTVNLFFLCYFKYAYFFTDILNQLIGSDFRVFDAFAWMGNMLSGRERFDVSTILLPVGISFYTFQNISYLMDVFRKRIAPVKEILNFGFYVTFFPQLVAGPIVRAGEFVPQIYKPYHLGRKQFGIAVFWILNGLVKKIVLSDYIAVNFVDRVFENPTLFSGFENLAALFGYSLQVYADFSGYTDIAIGVAMLMGFYLPKNFRSPYKALNPSDFWRRWHISLSNWLKDYLYIPLGGNRNATFATYSTIVTIGAIAIILSGSSWVGLILFLTMIIVAYIAYTYPQSRKSINTNLNQMNTMLLGGLWHGASWNFVIWGGLNGIGILVYKSWKGMSERRRMLLLLALTVFALTLSLTFAAPVLNIAAVWLSVVFAGNIVRLICLYLKHYSYIKNPAVLRPLGTAWAVGQTFVFISFTRLFFRSGSNLDPTEANRTAWDTAQNMVNQIGASWSGAPVGAMIYEYRAVLALIVGGMIIHWLPEKLKRRYRFLFAQMSLPAMAATVIVVVFILYQFITADLQKFIYFQF
jgi:D-alanyl-lipoteichoic acid acyltransferase DltB (MBOAT superfamily)